MMLVNAIELVRKLKRWWGQCLMIMELIFSFLILIGSILSVMLLPLLELSFGLVVSAVGLLVMGILQWRWRAAFWPSIRKHQRTLLEQTDLSA